MKCLGFESILWEYVFMPLFSLSGHFKRLKEVPFNNEREMQNLVEEQLLELFGLQFVASEFAPQGDLRIDTLAFDLEQKSFVIIEFKRGHSWSVIDQGATYLSLLLDRRDSFVLKLNQVHNTRLMPKDINWEASRVIFVAPSFNTYQEGSLGFRDLPIELWEIIRYEKDLIAMNRIQSSRKNAKLSELDNTSGDLKKVRSQLKQYTVDDHFKEGWDEGRDIFDALVPQLMALHPDFSLNTTKSHISLKVGSKVVFYIHPQKSGLVLDFTRSKPKDFKDPEKRMKYIERSMEFWHQHVSKLILRSEVDVAYALMLAKQVIKKYQ